MNPDNTADKFIEISPDEITDNVMKLIAEDWMLLSSGSADGIFNMMTASWGALGQLWHKRVAFIFVRPQRYTYQFMERNSKFTLSFFSEEYREALEFCGKNSGRNANKLKHTGLTAFEPLPDTSALEEARLIIICRKLYYQNIDPDNFLFPELDKLYPKCGYHRMYVGEILKVLKENSV